MKDYIVKVTIYRQDTNIHDIVGVYSSIHNAHIAIQREMKESNVKTDRIIMDKGKYRVDVPKEAVDEWTFPHTYTIESQVLDYGIDQDDDENDDD